LNVFEHPSMRAESGLEAKGIVEKCNTGRMTELWSLTLSNSLQRTGTRPSELASKPAFSATVLTRHSELLLAQRVQQVQQHLFLLL
jgi:hypothetical protein